MVRKIVSNATSSTCGEGFCLEVRSGAQNGGQSCGGCPTPPVVGVESLHRQPSPLPCRSFQDGDRELCASAQPGIVGRNEDHNKRSRFGSGADLDSTDYDHLDWHLTSPDATPALLVEGSRGKSPMTALAVHRKAGVERRATGIAVARPWPQAVQLSIC